MAYVSWSVVFGEQPSAAKWNILGTNDASFNDGTGIGTNAIQAASLDTDAITLGYAQSTSTFSNAPGSDTYADITNLSVTVTVPAGGRRCMIEGFIPSINSSAAGGNTVTLAIRESTTQLAATVNQIVTASYNITGIINYSAVLSAGSHTYKLSLKTSAAATVATTGVSATAPAYILVTAI